VQRRLPARLCLPRCGRGLVWPLSANAHRPGQERAAGMLAVNGALFRRRRSRSIAFFLDLRLFVRATRWRMHRLRSVRGLAFRPVWMRPYLHPCGSSGSKQQADPWRPDAQRSIPTRTKRYSHLTPTRKSRLLMRSRVCANGWSGLAVGSTGFFLRSVGPQVFGSGCWLRRRGRRNHS